ncbi:MAG: hypothetical protein A7316_00310 [Candidatus Altiarchaeales archaeon WOR_SM1_86-2]|nr:MAG: hypothetical protein A7316_00310 [Candidatus Altiarchaeales archaeon WOR_SM1_86-2]
MKEKTKKFIEEESYICARCGYCDTVCPTYNFNKDRWESVSPRGKLTLLRRGLTVKDPEFLDKLFQCALCGACKEVCQTDIDLTKMWLDLRKGASSDTLDSLVKFNDILNKSHNITDSPGEDRLRWTRRVRDVSQELIKEKADVCYFVGCVASLFPATNTIPQSFARIMDKAGIDFTILGGGEWCCGFPQMLSGFPGDAEKQITHNVELINKTGAKTLVTTCPGCYRVFKEEYKEILKEGDIRMNFRVLHSTEFIEGLIKDNKIKFKGFEGNVTYHDPCDLGRNSGIYDAPRKIIENIPGISFKELVDNKEECVCCGAGGNLGITSPDLSTEISRQKILQIKETGADTVISACQTCKRNIRTAAMKEKEKLKVLDITELVLEAME